MIVQHSSETDQHYTPADIVERARHTLGEIDLDPASCEVANNQVKAPIWFADDGLNRVWGGVDCTWVSNADQVPAPRVFLNPPGGKLDPDTFEPFKVGKLRPNGKKCSAADGLSSASVWWAKLWHEWNIGNVHSAVFVCFSMAIFRTAQEFSPEVPPPFAFPFCVPHARINYDRAEPREIARDFDLLHREIVRVPTKGAPADSALILIPPKDETPYAPGWSEKPWDGDTINRFVEAFSPLGVVRI